MGFDVISKKQGGRDWSCGITEVAPTAPTKKDAPRKMSFLFILGGIGTFVFGLIRENDPTSLKHRHGKTIMATGAALAVGGIIASKKGK